jgi:hypothetical protein
MAVITIPAVSVQALSAPANASAICKAAANASPIVQARCWCSYRAFSGRCYRWRCR